MIKCRQKKVSPYEWFTQLLFPSVHGLTGVQRKIMLINTRLLNGLHTD